jgi:transcriptional regulator with XRE-family HTH domain
MEKFRKNFKELRKEKKLSQLKTAKIFQVDQTTISTWELGKREPDYLTLKKICDFFEVSADYMIGRENEDGTKLKSNTLNQINTNTHIKGAQKK